MRNFLFLWMAALFATMHAAVEFLVTALSTVENANPSIALFFIRSFVARQSFLHLAAVTLSRNFNRTCTTNTLVTWSLTGVFTTGHYITTDLTTAPTSFVSCFETSSGRRLLPAETALHLTHACTWWARSSMAKLIARMRTCFGKFSVSSTSLTT